MPLEPGDLLCAPHGRGPSSGFGEHYATFTAGDAVKVNAVADAGFFPVPRTMTAK